MSSFDFGWAPKEEESYCKQHDLYNCWYNHAPAEEAVSVAIPVDPREQALEELAAKVIALQTTVGTYNDSVLNPLSESLNKVHQDQLHARDTFQKLMDELNHQYAEKQRLLFDARDERKRLQIELDSLMREQQNTIKSMKTEKILSEIEQKIDYLIADAPWGIDARSYQLIDLKYMLAAFETGKTGVLNANDMGLGKTFESIILDYCLQHLFPAKYDRMPLVLWVTTPNLIQQTVREIKRWNPGRKVVPVVGSWPKAQREWATNMAIEELALTVVNYEQLNSNDLLMNTEWDVIFADEVSKLKGGANPTPTKVWTNFQKMLWETKTDVRGNVTYKDSYDPTPRAKFFVPLSGTPIQNKPGDMWAYLHLFMPTKFPKLKNFEREYAYGWPDIKVNFDRLINVMSDQVIRRSKKDELKDLPDKIREMHEVEMTSAQRKLYESMRDNFFIYLDSNAESNISATVVIAWIIRLWQISLFPGIMTGFDMDMNEIPLECQESGVLDDAMDIVEQTLAAGEKILVWSSWFNEPLWEMKKRIEETCKVRVEVICGATAKHSDQYVQDFQEGDVQVLCINMKSGGYGLNLQNSSAAIFLDRWWNPKVMEQAEDRQHRMGQKNSVVIHQMHAMDTVYDFVLSKVEQKEEMADSIMESKELRKGSDWKDYLGGMM